MRSLILFGSDKKLTNAHKLVSHMGGPQPINGAKPQQPYYVRVKTYPGSFEEAFENVSKYIMEGEIFLNTVPCNS